MTATERAALIRRRDHLIEQAGRNSKTLFDMDGRPENFCAVLLELFVDQLNVRDMSEYLDCVAAYDDKTLGEKVRRDIERIAESVIEREMPDPLTRERQEQNERMAAEWEDFDVRR
jgi:hypothetical protein